MQHLNTPLLEALYPALRSSAHEEYGAVAVCPERATKLLRRMEHLCVEVLIELGLFSLENRRLQCHLIGTFQCLKGPCKKDFSRIFITACCDRTGCNEFKLKKGEFSSREKYFTMRVGKHQHRLPREMVDVLSLETFKTRWYRALSNLVMLKMSLLTAEGLELMSFEGLFQPKLFCDSINRTSCPGWQH